MKRIVTVLCASVFVACCAILSAAESATFNVTGDWTVEVKAGTAAGSFTVDPPVVRTIRDEKYDAIVSYDPKGPAWRKGIVALQVKAFECSVEDAVFPGTFKLRLDPNKDEWLVDGKDYKFDQLSGSFGSLDGGAIKAHTPVYASYKCVAMRLDSIVKLASGQMTLVKGTPHPANPEPPRIAADAVRLANIWVAGRIDKLTPELVFPILEPIPTPVDRVRTAADDSVVKQLLPKTWNKLIRGEKVRILAWGDSVTDGSFLPERDRWQHQFGARLRKAFPKAEIEVLTQAWGGRNSTSYFNEPSGSPKNYAETVLAVKPDLIVLEFVNDSGLNAAGVERDYGRMLRDFKAIGADWIICTPHYVRPAWMHFTALKNIDDDPRPYVTAIREFGAKNNIPIADVSVLYGRLWRQGIPYITLMVNNINHPNQFGMSLFAEGLMKLF